MLISRTLVKWGYNLETIYIPHLFSTVQVLGKMLPPANSNVLFSNEVGKSLCSGEEHGVGDVVDAGADHC